MFSFCLVAALVPFLYAMGKGVVVMELEPGVVGNGAF